MEGFGHFRCTNLPPVQTLPRTPQQKKGHIKASLWTPAADTRSGTGRGKLVPLPGASEREHRVKSTDPRCNRWREIYTGRCLQDVDDDACSVLFCAGNNVEITNFIKKSRLASAPLGLRWRFLGEGPGELLVADLLICVCTCPQMGILRFVVDFITKLSTRKSRCQISDCSRQSSLVHGQALSFLRFRLNNHCFCLCVATTFSTFGFPPLNMGSFGSACPSGV